LHTFTLFFFEHPAKKFKQKKKTFFSRYFFFALRNS
jgi:hypothetical protein